MEWWKNGKLNKRYEHNSQLGIRNKKEGEKKCQGEKIK
jgi:hypothetical protein